MSIHALGRARSGLSVVFALALVAAGAASAAAQQVAYVSASVEDACQVPSQPSDCTRGLISVVDVTTNQVQSSLEVWRGVQRGFLSFRAVLADRSGRLYVILTTTGSSHPPAPSFTAIQVFDTQAMRRITEFTVPGVVSSCVLSVDGERLFCARNVLASDVIVIDTATNAIMATIPAGFPSAIALSPSGHRLFVAHGGGSVSVHDATTYATLATVPLPATALSLAVTPDGVHLYALMNNRAIADVDTTTNSVAGLIPDVATGSNLPLDVAFAQGRAFVPTGGGTAVQEAVAVIDVASRTIVARIPIGNPLEAATSLDASRVFVSRDFGLTTINPATNQVVASTPLPDGPGRLALSLPQAVADIIVDVPVAGARVQQPFLFGGWAVDMFGTTPGPGIDTVHVWAFPASGASPVFLGAADYGLPRPDVAALFGTPYLNAGYQMTVRTLAPGAYTLTAFGHSTRTGTFSVARETQVTVESSLQMAVDAPLPGASVPLSFVVAGWALDAAAVSASGIDAVHVWAYPASGGPPVFAGAATLGIARPDVAAAFGPQFAAAGYEVTVQNLPPGRYALVVYARQRSSGTFAVERAVAVTVETPTPRIVVDLPAADEALNESVRVAGWAIEVGAATGTGVDAVHVWAYPSAGGAPILIGVAPYGGARPDVGAVFGARYAPSGFDVRGSLPPGSYDIVAFAHSTTTNTFRGVQVVHVTVQ